MTVNPRRMPLATAAVALLATVAAGAKTTTITFSHVWPASGYNQKAFEYVIAAFAKKRPDIKVKMLNSVDIVKLVTMMAGGTAPDVAVTDQYVSSYVLQNIPMALDSYIKKSRVSEKDFWAPSWRECVWDGKVWALPLYSDPNFGLWYNKKIFREARLPDKAPATMAEVQVVCQKVEILDPATRKPKRVGLNPWGVYGYPNSAYTWGWVFGGSFYNDATRKVTLTDPKIVKSLRWMKGYADLYGGIANVNALGFAAEKLAMAPDGPWMIREVKKAAPKLEFDIARMPVDAGVDEDPTWVGGHKVLIPNGSKHKNEAWEFLRFLCADPEGSGAQISGHNSFPAYKKATSYDVFKQDPYLVAYIKILQTAAHQRPVMPVSQFFDVQLNTVLDRVLTGKKLPEVALADAQLLIQKELDRVLARHNSRVGKK